MKSITFSVCCQHLCCAHTGAENVNETHTPIQTHTAHVCGEKETCSKWVVLPSRFRGYTHTCTHTCMLSNTLHAHSCQWWADYRKKDVTSRMHDEGQRHLSHPVRAEPWPSTGGVVVFYEDIHPTRKYSASKWQMEEWAPLYSTCISYFDMELSKNEWLVAILSQMFKFFFFNCEKIHYFVFWIILSS